MKVLNDFYCESCDATTENLVDNNETTVSCQSCGGSATKQRHPIRAKLHHSFPGESYKWEKKRAQKLKEEMAHSSYEK